MPVDSVPTKSLAAIREASQEAQRSYFENVGDEFSEEEILKEREHIAKLDQRRKAKAHAVAQSLYALVRSPAWKEFMDLAMSYVVRYGPLSGDSDVNDRALWIARGRAEGVLQLLALVDAKIKVMLGEAEQEKGEADGTS